jgi:L-ascorbate metabolism protein UlaG (beta-lactamase superfamily)
VSGRLVARMCPAAAALLLAIAGCWHAIGPGASGIVDLATPGRDTLRLVYLGTGGWIMEHGDATVLAAPLFTNPGLLRTGLASIASDHAEVDRQLGRYDVSSARAILVGHAHYDHLMDVPRVAKVHAPRARIVGSRTVANTLGTWSGLADRIDVVNDSVADQTSPGHWLWYGDDVRVLPLRSHHAPHFEGYTLYVGTREAPLAAAPRWAGEWVEGRTFAFLVDFMAAPDSVAFRIYYQDAVVAPPGGFAPDDLIARRPVDVAILVPATFDQVDWHPEAFIENLRPRRVLLGHWENFFEPVDEPARSIALTDLEHFEDRLSAAFDGVWWRPDRWTEFRFPGG